MKLRQWQNIFYGIVNGNPIVQHVIQIKNGTTNYVNENVKAIKSVKKTIVGILRYVFVE